MKKKKKFILPLVVVAAVLAGIGIWQGMRPKEVTNYEAAFEAGQEAPDDRAESAPEYRFPDISP